MKPSQWGQLRPSFLVWPFDVRDRVRIVAALLCDVASGCGSSGPRPSTDPRASADAYLAALRSQKGSRVCKLLDAHARRTLLVLARSEGLNTTDCAKAGDHVYRGARALAVVRVIRVMVHGREADATVDDAQFSNSGNDTFTLRRAVDGRWYIHEM